MAGGMHRKTASVMTKEISSGVRGIIWDSKSKGLGYGHYMQLCGLTRAKSRGEIGELIVHYKVERNTCAICHRYLLMVSESKLKTKN